MGSKIEPWGRLTQRDEPTLHPRFQSDVLRAVNDEGPLLPRGLGRSYGDVGTAAGQPHLQMTDLDRVISFDRETGRFRAEAGMSLSDMLKVVVPHGFFLPTTPGSRFVTLGGAVANDVHGKNHHGAGTLGCHVTALELARTDGTRHLLTPQDESGLFAATIGGLGLTGVILWVELQLVKVGSSWLDTETLSFDNLNEFMDLAESSDGLFEHTVSWIDCLASGKNLGRGIFSRANWSDDGQYKPHDDSSLLRMPIDLPGFALNGLSVRMFNTAYHAGQMRKLGQGREHYAPFFYPLDAIGQWNRMYGSKGFFQYQSVTPMAAGVEPVREMLDLTSSSGQGSFLAVLKTFGNVSSPGLLSFPFEGLTLALDFPNKGEQTLKLFDRLDSIVTAVGGRIYPAKDARMPRALFTQGYPDKEKFLTHRDPGIASDFAERMFE
ncbi:MAG: FAD-binding oxidoreductase [Pseudomonadota bacterium]